ncbi:hypothetical protein PR202_ga04301 [Eleusine coracana subsp. coracana]|uniref:Uncharacterized protein n=1 Tax=Eleusine coracana subsp. coracana TaxID=191504 RepID=A0AAV5BP98_ELECO|nr:hypothetical protein PR202_ga04301 [Eleusine coracana subsp. coracana]
MRFSRLRVFFPPNYSSVEMWLIISLSPVGGLVVYFPQDHNQQVKNLDETCYAVGAVHEEQVHNLRQGLEERFGYLPQHVILSIFQYMQDMNQCTASMENPEENMNDANQVINDRSSDNQNLGHGGVNEDGAMDDVVTNKDVDNTIAESGGANGELRKLRAMVKVKVKKTLYMLKMLGSKEQVQSKTKSPYFNSPSVPPFRIFDDEDDLGNYVADPSKRRPVGESGPTFHRQSTSKSQRNSSETSCGQNTNVPNDKVIDDHEDVLIMELLPFTDEISKEFAKRHKCKTTTTVDAEVSSLAISPVVPPEQAAPLAVKTPDGEYVYVSRSPDDVAIIGSKILSQKCSDLSNECDKMYNWSFGSAQHAVGSSSGKMAMYRPRRFSDHIFVGKLNNTSII